VSNEDGPREASVDDVVAAIAAAMRTSYTDPGWRTAWEHVDTTGNSHLRSVRRGRQQVTDRVFTPTLAEPHPERYSHEAAANGDYAALCGKLGCKSCEASEAAWAAEDAARDAAWKEGEASREADRAAGQ
jgi:hypothetical protein